MNVNYSKWSELVDQKSDHWFAVETDTSLSIFRNGERVVVFDKNLNKEPVPLDVFTHDKDKAWFKEPCSHTILDLVNVVSMDLKGDNLA